MLTFLQDVRYTLRQLRQAPGFALTAVLTLALGIGATTAIFTLVHAVLLRSLPVSNPGELWRVGSHNECCFEGGYRQESEQHRPDFSIFSNPFYEYLRDHTPGFSSLAAFQGGQNSMSVRRQGSSDAPVSWQGIFVSGNAFSTLGVPAYVGRTIAPSDDRQGAPPVAMMSYQAWTQSFGSSPSIAGSTFLINGQPVTIIGVTPPGFYGARLTDTPPAFYLPIATMPLIDAASSVLPLPTPHWLHLIGRIPQGTDVRTVNAEVNVALQQWLHSHYAEMTEDERKHLPEQKTQLTPGGAGITAMQETFASGLHILLAASLFVLLIACANLANLTLVRGMARRQQTSVRLAVGASRARLVRQALVESVILSLLGGVAGLLVAFAGTHMILHLAFAQAKGLPLHATPSLPVLGFCFAASLLTGVLFGIAPALVTSHTNPVEALRGANRATQRGAALPQKVLVVVQAALSLVLLSAAALLTGSLTHLVNQRYGYEPNGRVVVHMDSDRSMSAPEQYAAFYRRLADVMRNIPGVTGVSYSLYSPMEGDNWSTQTYVAGKPPSPKPEENSASFNRVGPHYFEVLGTKIVRGRDMTEDEIVRGTPVAVVNEAFARKFFGSKDPVGQHIGLNELSHAGDYQIVGVSEDTRYSTWDLHEPIRSMWFSPLAHWTVYDKPEENTMEGRGHFANALVLQTSASVSSVEPQVRRALASIDPNIAIYSIETMQQQVTDQFTQESLVARLAGLFGILALVLASVGLYGVTAYTVERRTSEIGIRMALGADRVSVLRLVMRSAFGQVLIGLVIGIPAALLAGRLISGQLYGIAPYNPVVLCAAALLLAACAGVAALVPAGRAAKIEPIIALRAE